MHVMGVYVVWQCWDKSGGEHRRVGTCTDACTPNALRCDSTNYLQRILFPQKPGHIFSLSLVNASLSEGTLHIFREKGGIISHPPWSVNWSLKKGRGTLFTPQSADSFIKTCWPIIFINQPVSLLTTPGSSCQHTHAFMNVHTDKRKYPDHTESCCWLRHHIFPAQKPNSYTVRLWRI